MVAVIGFLMIIAIVVLLLKGKMSPSVFLDQLVLQLLVRIVHSQKDSDSAQCADHAADYGNIDHYGAGLFSLQ